MEDIFIELIQVALGNRECLSRVPDEQEWRDLSTLCQKQAISGIVFHALDSLSKYGQKPPLTVLYEWIGYAQQIEMRNRAVNQACVKIVNDFEADGYSACILKGQGNAALYTNPLLRTPGDIDVYLIGTPIRKAIHYVRSKNPNGRAQYHHIDYGDVDGVDVESHYRPSFLFSPFHNHRLQKWFKQEVEKGGKMVELPEGAGEIPVPSWEFNIVFQLCHIYNHVLHEGIGLRHLIDYYYLLMSDGRSKREDVAATLNRLGLTEIAGAMMWVLGYLVHGERSMVHGLKKDEWMICEPDERRGRFLFDEIMQGGDYGRGRKSDGGWLNSDSAVGRNILRLKRDIRLMRYFPSECLWEPVFRVWHYLWRLAH